MRTNRAGISIADSHFKRRLRAARKRGVLAAEDRGAPGRLQPTARRSTALPPPGGLHRY
jgi:hypothetical protein